MTLSYLAIRLIVGFGFFCQQVVSVPEIMQPNRASRRPIIEIDINEVVQGSDNPRTSSRQSNARTSQQRPGSLDQRTARQGTPATGQGSLDSGSLNPHASPQGSLNPPVAGIGSLDPGSLGQCAARSEARSAEQGLLDYGSLNPHASQQGSLNPPVARTGSLDPGSLDQRAARLGARSAEQGSLDSGSLNPHASQQGSLDPPVAGTGSLDPGSLDQRVASPRTNGSSVSVEVEVVTSAFTIATAGTSSGSKRTPVRYGAGTPMPGRMAIER